MVDTTPPDRRSVVWRRAAGRRRAIVRARGRVRQPRRPCTDRGRVPATMETLDDWRRLGEALPGDVEYASFSSAMAAGRRGLALGGDQVVRTAAGYGHCRRPPRRDDAASWSTPVRERRGHHGALSRPAANDAGTFALALKAQTIHAPAEGFFVVERRFLEAAIESVTRDGFTRRLGATLGALAKRNTAA